MVLNLIHQLNDKKIKTTVVDPWIDKSEAKNIFNFEIYKKII